jgi:hypothetical protein
MSPKGPLAAPRGPTCSSRPTRLYSCSAPAEERQKGFLGGCHAYSHLAVGAGTIRQAEEGPVMPGVYAELRRFVLTHRKCAGPRRADAMRA